ncbi:MAG: HPr family phosphocarrier protein [Solibacillus sp.]
MIIETIQILNKTGIHARPASQLVKAASTYESSVSIVKGEKKVNAKSILGVMGLAMAYNDQIELIIEGTDEEKAMVDIKALFENKFGEG